MRHRHKLSACAIALAVMTAATSLASPLSSFAAAYAKVDGTYQMPNGTPITNVHARGIDVSHWKQNIDWNAVAADDVQFVMLGTRYDGDVDPYFRINADGASKAGVKLGAYIYSYATTPEMAAQEADFVLDLIKDYPISYPVAFDVEANVQSTLTPDQLHDIIHTFCGKIRDAGYYPIVYANDYWLANKIDTSRLEYEVWAARYEAKPVFQNYVMWQATSTGAISGVQGNVDINFQYKDFTNDIPANLWRTIAGKTYYYKDHAMQKNSWIDDGTGWFYIGADGQAVKGWLTASDGRYYLDPENGKMHTGWKLLDGNWYYLSDSGKMATGWTSADNMWYYLSEDGTMKTGWQLVNGKYYYLKDTGAMATGWVNPDGNWYYLNPGGDMATGWITTDTGRYYLEPSGKMVSGWHTEGADTYYLSANSGRMVTGWRQVDGAWYYFDASGLRHTGALNVDGKLYYLDPSTGVMAANTTVSIDGAEYTAGSDGVCVKAGETAQPDTQGEAGGLGDSGAVPPETGSSSEQATPVPPNNGEAGTSAPPAAGPGASI